MAKKTVTVYAMNGAYIINILVNICSHVCLLYIWRLVSQFGHTSTALDSLIKKTEYCMH